MKLFILLAAVIAFSDSAFATGEAPAPSAFSCVDSETKEPVLEINVQAYRTDGANGPAEVQLANESIYSDLSGGWNWKAEPEMTRLTGYSRLHVVAKSYYVTRAGFPFKTSKIDLLISPETHGKNAEGWVDLGGALSEDERTYINCTYE